jgi:transposase
MEAYSLDLRGRICVAYDEGVDSVTELAEQFNVGRWFIHKLLRQRRVEGSIATKAGGRGPAPRIGAADQQRIRKLIGAKPDSTLSELCAGLQAAGGICVSVPTMCRATQSLQLPLKKRRCMPASEIRRGSGPCGGISRNALRRWIRRRWSSWMKAGSTPR